MTIVKIFLGQLKEILKKKMFEARYDEFRCDDDGVCKLWEGCADLTYWCSAMSFLGSPFLFSFYPKHAVHI